MSSDDSRWYERRAVEEQQREWYSKLKKDGFKDCEGGVEGHLLTGPTPSKRLGAAKMRMPEVQPWREFDEVADESHATIDYQNASKARYYHYAQLIAAQAFRSLEDPEMCLVWALHSQGEGERSICEDLRITRGKIRKHLKVLRDSILPKLDARVDKCYPISKEDE